MDMKDMRKAAGPNHPNESANENKVAQFAMHTFSLVRSH